MYKFKAVLLAIGTFIVLFFFLLAALNTIPIRPHENDVVFDGYTIVALVCYNCGVTFELGNGYYVLGRIHCNNCYEKKIGE